MSVRYKYFGIDLPVLECDLLLILLLDERDLLLVVLLKNECDLLAGRDLFLDRLLEELPEEVDLLLVCFASTLDTAGSGVFLVLRNSLNKFRISLSCKINLNRSSSPSKTNMYIQSQ